MEIDFVIPALNSEKTLHRCLASIVNLETSGIKTNIFLVDNGSVDSTVRIAQTFAEVTVLNCPERGRSQARNKGIQHGSAELIAFVDSDVELDKYWLTNLLKCFEFHSLDAAQGQIISAGEDNSLNIFRYDRKKKMTHGTFVENESEHMQIPLINTAASIFRRSAIEKISLFDTDLIRGEDFDLTLRLVLSGGSLGASLTSKAYVYFDGSRLDYLRRTFSASFHSAKYGRYIFGFSRPSMVKAGLDELLFHHQDFRLYSTLNNLFAKLGLLIGIFATLKKRPLSLTYQSSKRNLTIPFIEIEKNLFNFSPFKRFYLSDRTLCFYGINQKRELRFYHKPYLDFFHKFLLGKLNQNEIDDQKEFLNVLISEKVLVRWT